MKWVIDAPSEMLHKLAKDQEMLDQMEGLQVDISSFSDDNKIAVETIAYAGVPILCASSLLPDHIVRNLENVDSFFLNLLQEHVQKQISWLKTFGCSYVSVSPVTAITKDVEKQSRTVLNFWEYLSSELANSVIKLCFNYTYPLLPGMNYVDFSDNDSLIFFGYLDLFMNNLNEEHFISEILKECPFNISAIRINYTETEGIYPDEDFLINLKEELDKRQFKGPVIFHPLYEKYRTVREEWQRISQFFNQK